jgi:WD40 repeat protein
MIPLKDSLGTVLAPPTGWELRYAEIGKSNRPPTKLAVFDREPGRIALAGGRVAVIAGDKIRVWDVRAGRELWTEANPGSGRNQPIQFSPDGSSLAVWQCPYIVRSDKEPIEETVQIHNAETGQFVVFSHNKRIECFAFHPNGEQIAWIDADGTFILWNAKTGAVTRTQKLGQKKGLGGDVHTRRAPVTSRR